ncbi:hypothetical protein J5U21_01864 [Saccharolobus shibatae]|nr:hypothetical protein J5U21_01864 [Saccharolobus shibatae]
MSPANYTGHLVTILIITRPNGTWVDPFYPNLISPVNLVNLNVNVLYDIVVMHDVTPTGKYLVAYQHIVNAQMYWLKLLKRQWDEHIFYNFL